MFAILTTDINECVEAIPACASNTLCSNTQGSYNCTCNSGFSGDGFTSCVGTFLHQLVYCYLFPQFHLQILTNVQLVARFVGATPHVKTQLEIMIANVIVATNYKVMDAMV